ncbi:hypothetical protein E2562_016511 [Oryza meyeriana var. granulata]|uniref:Uncharacterized protein n=1 Tax=Oryza meyeriana var. granulata TaxID=110450 RepID=A0A6G1C6I7_9ORYZ|nr:hypothetical protein E2562_016511 [Oryza meyeriana var. granulata]
MLANARRSTNGRATPCLATGVRFGHLSHDTRHRIAPVQHPGKTVHGAMLRWTADAWPRGATPGVGHAERQRCHTSRTYRRPPR